MKTIKKVSAVLLSSVVAATSLAGCGYLVDTPFSDDISWSYKDDDTTLSIGTYIFEEFMAYQNAAQQINDSSKDVLIEKVKNDDDKEVTGRDFVLTKAELECKKMLIVNKTFKDMNLTLTDEEKSAGTNNSTSAWQYYGANFKKYGISKESFVEAYGMYDQKYTKIFKTLYGEGGEKEVSKSDIEKYFKENFTDYSFFSVPLYDSATSDDASAASSTTAKSDEEIKKIKESLDKYAKAINDEGKSFKDEADAYMKDYNVSEDPTTTNVAILDDAGLGDELKKAIEKLDENKAAVVKVGEDNNSALYYLVYKGAIADQVKTLSDEESNMSFQVIKKLKSDEYEKDITEAAKKIKCETNESAISKYDPSMFAEQETSSN